MENKIEFVDRYSATGTPYPDPETMCLGQCEGMGVYPHQLGSEGETPEERAAWEKLHITCLGKSEEACDGWHFITCPDCNGTRLRKVG